MKKTRLCPCGIGPDTHVHNLVCPVGEQFGAHGGAQWRSPRYFIKCGCDSGYCENHAKPRTSDPFGPKFEPGNPRKCRKHSKAGK